MDRTISVEGLSKSYRTRRGVVHAVKDVTFQAAHDDFVVLLGPSGCGKTTILRCIAGLEMPDRGRIEIAGRVVVDVDADVFVPPHERHIGMVFQSYALWPHMSVSDNVAYPLASTGVPKRDRTAPVSSILEAVGCLDLASRMPTQLSGGQQQRVALARAMVGKPPVILFDEPLSNLDAPLRLDVRAHLKAVHREVGFGAVYVTHDRVEGMGMATKVIVLMDGEIAQEGEPAEVYERPHSKAVARFLGTRNHLHVRMSDDGWSIAGTHVSAPTAPTSVPADVDAVMFRPATARLAPPVPDAPLAGEICVGQGVVERSMFGGDVVDYIVRVGDERIHVRAGIDTPSYRETDTVSVNVPVNQLRFYDAMGHRCDVVFARAT